MIDSKTDLDYTQCPVKECGITYATKFFTNDKIEFVCPCCGHEWSSNATNN